MEPCKDRTFVWKPTWSGFHHEPKTNKKKLNYGNKDI